MVAIIAIESGLCSSEPKSFVNSKGTIARMVVSEVMMMERNRRVRGDLYITQIIDEEMTSDDARLR